MIGAYIHGKLYDQDHSWLGYKQYKDFCNYIIESPYVDKMKKTFIGWPLDSRIGGYSIDSKLEEDHRISAEDTHPNAKGHKFIAGVLYNEYEKIYS